MKKFPKTISILDAAKAFNCPTGAIWRKLQIFVATGQEQVAFSKLVESFQCPPEFLADCLVGNDRALTREQAAALLGVKTHSLNIVSKCRADILPIAKLGFGRGAGTRYSRKTIEAHLANHAA
jgi:hypothetical protein